jgi:O-antigen ligase
MKPLETSAAWYKYTGPVLTFLCALTFISVCFIPYLPVSDQLSIRLEDLLLPFALVLIAPAIKEIGHWYFMVLILWGIWGVISMAVNGRITVVNDYFELYKLFKYMIFTIMFALFFIREANIFGFVSVTFILLVLFNLMHYFNVFDFNRNVMPVFCPNPMQLEYFGRNSLGGIATKRILGTMGNPNVNAILFSFFTTYFITFLREKKWNLGKLFFFVSVAMVLYTQSRTCMAATFFIIVLYVFITKPGRKELALLGAGLILAIAAVWFSDIYSLNYLTQAKWDVEQNGSLRGRLEVWKELIGMVGKSPVFGYGINKNYFYEHDLYSENEYILMLWRYGIPGLFFYLVMVFGWVWKGRSFIVGSHSGRSLSYLLAVVMIGINAMTNNPLSNPMIMILFAAVTGYFISNSKDSEGEKVLNIKRA